jgi:hypothetical protein
MPTLLAIDPGSEKSAWVSYNSESKRPLNWGKIKNRALLEQIDLDGELLGVGVPWFDYCVIEKVASYGMAVGAEVFETVYWSGIFAQAFGLDHVVRIPRKDIKLHLCGRPQANDSNIRQALVDKYGGKDKAIGTKKTGYGPLHGFAHDTWSALAVAITAAETVLK